MQKRAFLAEHRPEQCWLGAASDGRETTIIGIADQPVDHDLLLPGHGHDLQRPADARWIAVVKKKPHRPAAAGPHNPLDWFAVQTFAFGVLEHVQQAFLGPNGMERKVADEFPCQAREFGIARVFVGKAVYLVRM